MRCKVFIGECLRCRKSTLCLSVGNGARVKIRYMLGGRGTQKYEVIRQSMGQALSHTTPIDLLFARLFTGGPPCQPAYMGYCTSVYSFIREYGIAFNVYTIRWRIPWRKYRVMQIRKHFTAIPRCTSSLVVTLFATSEHVSHAVLPVEPVCRKVWWRSTPVKVTCILSNTLRSQTRVSPCFTRAKSLFGPRHVKERGGQTENQIPLLDSSVPSPSLVLSSTTIVLRSSPHLLTFFFIDPAGVATGSWTAIVNHNSLQWLR